MILGVTGHQDLSKFNINWIKSILSDFLDDNNVEKGLTSLAIGADQLFADKLRILNIKYDVILPCLNYESTFTTEEALDFYKSLLNSSENVYTLNFFEPSNEAFFAAGIEILTRSSTIIAIWNGEQAKGLGGTGDIVAAALKQDIRVYHINPVKQTNIYLQ